VLGLNFSVPSAQLVYLFTKLSEKGQLKWVPVAAENFIALCRAAVTRFHELLE
jgi:hypothetical protein